MLSIDRISALPDDLLDHVLDKLPMEKVFQTSILSKRWRPCCRRYVHLDFTTEFFEDYVGSEKEPKLDRIIDQVLSLHIGHVSKFGICFWIDAHEQFRSLDLSKWLQILSENGIKDFSFTSRIVDGAIIPSSIFSCSDLQHLVLEDCKLELPEKFKGFRKLITLKLRRCTIPDRILHIMISNAPLLEVLKLQSIELVDPITIDAPHLKKLLYEFCKRKLYLKECARLASAKIMSEVTFPLNSPATSTLDQFVDLMPMIQKLAIDEATYSSLATEHLSMKLSKPVQNLCYLALHGFDVISLHHAKCAFCLIRNSPNLQTLNIYVKGGEDTNELAGATSPSSTQFLDQQASEGDFASLRFVQFGSLLGRDSEYWFIRTILMCSPKLEFLFVRLSRRIDKSVKRQFLQALSYLPKASLIKWRLPDLPRSSFIECQLLYGRWKFPWV